MKEKDFKGLVLYDLYAPLLSEKKREVFEMYYWDDLSLAEISEHTGTSRQGVRELIVRTVSELSEYERALGLLEKEKKQDTEAKLLLKIADKIETAFPDEAQLLRTLTSQKGE